MEQFGTHPAEFWLHRFLPWLSLWSLAMALVREGDLSDMAPDQLQG